MSSRKTQPDLAVRWSMRETTYRDGRASRGALTYFGPGSTGAMLASFFERLEYPDKKTMAQELDDRGYDLTTLRFSIRKKVPR